MKPQSSSSSTSSILVGMAIIGKSNEPLYLCDCEKIWQKIHASNAAEEPSSCDDTEKDPFGFQQNSLNNTEQRNSLSLAGQILVHAALDPLEELVEHPSGSKNGPRPVIRKSAIIPEVSSSSSPPPPHWLGLLLHSPSDGHSVFGYITATNIKLLAIVKDVPADASSIAIKLIQSFLQEVHQHLIAYVLNPFCDTRGGSLVSEQLDQRIAHSVTNLRQSTIRVD
jgi:Sedlin, N-terminal conserved region